MQKLWSYIAIFLTGVITGLIVMYKLAGEQISVTIRKVKNKRTSGHTSTVIPIEIKKAEKGLKRTKAERKADRLKRKSNA